MSLRTTVAKKKQDAPKRDAPEVPDSDRLEFVRVRVSGTFKKRLMRIADAGRSDMSDRIDDALTAHAKAKDLEPPPKC